MSENTDAYMVGMPLPLEARMRFEEMGGQTGGAMDLPGQTLFMALPDYRPDDAGVFSGPARFRVARMKTFMILSPAFSGFNFDMIWSPAIAKASGEPDMDPVEKGQHPAFTFILTDGRLVVRAIRVSTLSPAAGKAIRRARRELMKTEVDPRDLDAEMRDLFMKNPRGLPDAMFHEICDLGD